MPAKKEPDYKGHSNNVDIQLTWSLENVVGFLGPCHCSNKVDTSKVAIMSAVDVVQIYNSDDSEDVDVEPSLSQTTFKTSQKCDIFDLKFKLEHSN